MTVQTKSEMHVECTHKQLVYRFYFLKLSSLKFIYAKKSTLQIQGELFLTCKQNDKNNEAHLSST